MGQAKIQRKAILFTTAAGIALCIAGCDASQAKVESLQQQNQVLTQRIADLEEQLQQAAIQNEATAAVLQPAAGSVYLVVQGDSLWSIAAKELGNGNRYKEIMALNPHISMEVPLKIGTQLKLPPK